MKPRRTRSARHVIVIPAVRHYLTWGNWDEATALLRPQDNVFSLFPHGVGRFNHRVIWDAIADAAVAEWTTVHPGSRPDAWWTYSAPEPRRPKESERDYLTRLNLLLPGERVRATNNGSNDETKTGAVN